MSPLDLLEAEPADTQAYETNGYEFFNESISESTSTSKSINNIVIDYYNNGSGNFDLLVNSKNFSTNAQLNKLLDGFQKKKLINGYLSSPSRRSVVDIDSKLSKKKLISSLAELYTKVSDPQGKVLN